MHKSSVFSAALALALSAVAASASAADFRVYGNVVTGLFYQNNQNGDTTSGLAGKGQVPEDSSIHIEGKEDLGNGYYVGFNLGPKFTVDDGQLFQENRLFTSSRMFFGNESVEFAFGGMAGLTVVGEPYSSYARLDANMCQSQLDGIAPAAITYQPGDLTNAVAFSTPMWKKGFFISGLYSNGDSNATDGDTESLYGWSDRRHVAQLSSGWVGERLRAGFVYSYEMPGNYPNADGSHNKRRNATHALHLMASYNFGGPAVAGILFYSKDAWRLGPVNDLGRILSQSAAAAEGNKVIANSDEGMEVEAAIITARYPFGSHQFSASLGYMHGSWEGVENVGRDDSGSVLQGGVMYRYFLSKKTSLYSTIGYMDGRDLFKEIPRYNKYLVGCGLAMKF